MEKLRVEDLMTSDVISVRQNEDLATLHDLMMDNHIRHIPVVDDENCVVGLISHRDLVGRAISGNEQLPVTELQQLLRQTKVREIMMTGVETVEPDEEVEEAARIMLESKYGCLPVTENGQIVGILTEADFVRCVADEQREIRNNARREDVRVV